MTILKTTIATTIILLTYINLFAQQKQDTTTVIKNNSVTVITDTVTIIEIEKESISELPSNKVNIDTTGEFNLLIKDSQVLTTLDQLLYEKFYKKNFFNADTIKKDSLQFTVNETPTYHDSIYAQRIESLNIETPIELTYNKEVKSFINLYAVKKKDLTARMLGLAEIYFPLFEETLDKYDMPLEISIWQSLSQH